VYIFQGFEMAYLAQAQMHKRQIPRIAAELRFERRVAFEVEKLSAQEKAELTEKIRRQFRISQETTLAHFVGLST